MKVKAGDGLARAGRGLGLSAGLALATALAGCASAPTGGPAASAIAPTGSDHSTWSAYAGAADAAQYSALTQIDRSNVGQLQVAWTFPAGTVAPTFGATVANGMVYVLSDGKQFVALDPVTGQERWRSAEYKGVGARGVNYWQSANGKDKRLLFLAGGSLHAISADTGQPMPGFGTDGGVDLRGGLEGDVSAIQPLSTSNPGRIFGDLIIMSLPAGRSGNDYATSPGDVHAYDVRTGKLAWVFHVIPKKGEPGSETWPEADREKFGGVHNWSELTVDTKRGIAFVPTGTARYDFFGGNRRGNNLYANSVVALDARTGKLLWHYQAVHHDLWDYDLPIAPKLMTIRKDGRTIPVVVQAAKHGYIFVLDEMTGKPIWPVEEKPVPASDVPGEHASPTQPVPTLPKPFARQSFTEADIDPYIPDADKEKLRQLIRNSRDEGLFTPPSLRGTIYLPGHNGGASWGEAAADPVNGRYYIISRDLPVYVKLIPSKNPKPMPNGAGLTPYTAPYDFMLQSNGLTAISPPWSTITAYDMNTGQMLWQKPNGTVPQLTARNGGDTGAHVGRGLPVLTATGLLFNATSTDRKFRARDSATGEVVWEHDLPAGSEGIPAVYEAGGREFIVLPVGGAGLWAPKLDGTSPPGPSQYMAFALPAK